MSLNTMVVAVRHGHGADDTTEVLCLRGSPIRGFRLFLTTLDNELREIGDDLAPVDFDNANDPEVTLFLIESFWRIDVSESDIHAACKLLTDGEGGSWKGINESNGPSLRPFGQLLANLVDQLLNIRVEHLEASSTVGRIQRTLSILGTLPYLTLEERSAIDNAQRQLIALEATLKTARLRGDG